MEDTLQIQRDLAQARGRSRALPATLPGRSSGNDPQDERRVFEANRSTARAAEEAPDENTPAFLGQPNNPTTTSASSDKNPSLEKAWSLFWDGLMIILKTVFFATIWTILLPIFIIPIIFVLYAYRLFGVNLRNSGKPKRFPILGIVDILVPKIDIIKIPTALAWVMAGALFFVFAILIVAGIIFLMAEFTDACSTLGPFCALLPDLL